MNYKTDKMVAEIEQLMNQLIKIRPELVPQRVYNELSSMTGKVCTSPPDILKHWITLASEGKPLPFEEQPETDPEVSQLFSPKLAGTSVKLHETHWLYQAKDFTEEEYERGNLLATAVIDGDHAICRLCGKTNRELVTMCRRSVAYRAAKLSDPLQHLPVDAKVILEDLQLLPIPEGESVLEQLPTMPTRSFEFTDQQVEDACSAVDEAMGSMENYLGEGFAQKDGLTEEEIEEKRRMLERWRFLPFCE